MHPQSGELSDHRAEHGWTFLDVHGRRDRSYQEGRSTCGVNSLRSSRAGLEFDSPRRLTGELCGRGRNTILGCTSG